MHLAVEQLEVPAEHESRLFLGVMRFKHEDEATKAFQRGIKKGRAVAEAAEPFEGKAVPTIVTEVDGTVQYINAACEALLGWPRAELLGKNVKYVATPLFLRSRDPHGGGGDGARLLLSAMGHPNTDLRWDQPIAQCGGPPTPPQGVGGWVGGWARGQKKKFASLTSASKFQPL